ncbi:MAG: hypothetical protein COZ49_04070 [Candidatus Yonathbacteria bacterium CG_4_10_14_3_um_filter_47_65]|uniref:Uncharacterized protein n=2 Tax=Parcubacteria group TaxID=1794811 RepID=A0A2M8D5K8_9BACT|nr:MAG: hypothetical protein AUJ44_01470 [Candidatus Nomurabacteria bacterium CG1_02_47_685]PIP03416.1 MAG: hypothetical protein COX54_03740 [Candidatus Yonathbacteria bacterium CG23_combo_of_CG06-09_8_20_14_all_46_18]PIQ32267.1 MAG: hypothetical protein COW61_01910 [Candidatus Yonathbacteria bacterium CG17_big_fil_post_rev_8_21_14_2_50_46_19]PIX56066.1 MAG: hypothetical protein COZ49_04070 [Candidatus Yonathbacteria bacterium CG_4_10_14_3_um_filter_47_65]PIY57576.1 MAG: hypothetical protein CO
MWNSYSATWTPKNVIDGVYSATFEIRVTIDDGEAANNTASLASSDTALDVKDPTLGGASIVVQASTTPASLMLSATDNSSLDMKIGLASDLSDGSWVSYTSGSTATLASDPDTVYAQFKDAFSNTSAIQSATTPDTPTAMMVQDITNTNTTPEEYRLFVAWGGY